MWPEAKAEMVIIFNAGDVDGPRWECEISPIDGTKSVIWKMQPGCGPGTLLNKAVRWSEDRGLQLVFVKADVYTNPGNAPATMETR